jgi:hypothetical protein
LNGCENPNNNGNQDFEIELNSVYVNYYEDDSLNMVRPYVIPRIYFDFNVDNSSADSVIVLLNTHFDRDSNKPYYLYVCFEYSGIKDTLLLTDYESVNPLIFTPNSVDGFTVGVPISEYLEKDLYKSETNSTFMKYVADHGVVYYSNPNQKENKKVLGSQLIKKSNSFEVVFRDPEDTAVE